jgi:hypothetical protein
MAKSGLVKLLFSVIFLTAKGEDFFYPQEDFEDENLEEEVDFPGGDSSLSKVKTMADVTREPFQILIFDAIKMKWREPHNEKEKLKEIEEQLDRSWHSTVLLDMEEAMTNPEVHHTAKTIRATDIHHFFSKFVNPTDEPLTGEEEVLLDERVEELRLHEGLFDMNNNQRLHFGYLTRGYPRRILDSTMNQLKELRATTGDRRLAEEIQLNRERPLLQRRAAEKIAQELKIKEEMIAAENAAAAKLVKEDREAKRKRLAEKAAEKMKEAESKRKS